MRNGEVRPLHAKIESVLQYPRPPKKKEIRAFLGLTNYYRCFVPAYGSIAVSLTDATRKTFPDVLAERRRQEKLSNSSR